MSETAVKPGKIFAAMAAIMRKVGAVGKNGQAEGSARYSYRKIDDVYLALQGLMAEHGVFSLGEVIEQRREERPTQRGGTLTYTILTIRHTFYAEDGSFVQDVVVGEGMDSSDKSSNKATSAAEKYSLVTAFKIPTQELRDSETDDHRPAARQPARFERTNGAAAAPARPAVPPPAPVPPANGGRFTVVAHDKLRERGLSDEETEDAIRAIAESYEVRTLDDLDAAQRSKVLRGIAAGQADRWRHAPA